MNRSAKFALLALALTSASLAGAQGTHTTGSMSMSGAGRCAKVLTAKANLAF